MVKFSWPVNLAFEKYESGLSSKDIAKKYGIHHASVQRGFKKVFGNKYTTIAQKRKPKRILSEDEIKHTFELYKRGKSVYRLAKDYKVEDEVIYRHFRKIPKYHEISQVRRLKRKVSKQDVLCAFEDYKNGATLTSLVKKYKISWNALICAFRRFSELEYKKIAKEHRLRESVNNLKLAVKINQKVNVASDRKNDINEKIR